MTVPKRKKKGLKSRTIRLNAATYIELERFLIKLMYDSVNRELSFDDAINHLLERAHTLELVERTHGKFKAIPASEIQKMNEEREKKEK